MTQEERSGTHLTTGFMKVLRDVREFTTGHPAARMQVPPDQGRFMSWLVETMQVKKAVEVGVFTGYSSTAVAMV